MKQRKIKVSKRQLKALKHCIDKRWVVLADKKRCWDSVPSCGLCKISEGCKNCIIYKKIGGCEFTSYNKWYHAVSVEASARYAERMLEFLQDLYKEAKIGYIKVR